MQVQLIDGLAIVLVQVCAEASIENGPFHTQLKPVSSFMVVAVDEEV